ncbi:TPM domain-containing protein [Povalibacter sp.]|uniref:TPM domain-containing protein n=1 Tax=Povalibacter sp. TaxID=1962978 RepID=UPI0039C93426
MRGVATGLLAVWILLLCAVTSFAQVAVPPLTAPVMDQTRTLTPSQISSLEQTIRDLYQRKGSQITVLIVPTTQPEAIEQYSIRVVDSWKLGRKDIADGVLLLVAKDDRAVRIEVGYGLEGAIPDVIASRIVQQVIVPRFRQGDYYGGISQGVARLVALIEGEVLPEPQQGEQRSVQGIGSLLPMLFVLVVIGGGILRRLFGGFGGAGVIGGIAGVIAYVLTSVIGVAIGTALLAFIFTLFGGGGGFGGGGWSSHRRGGGLGGGWGGGFGGGGLGGGGWSGGGGGFGGGGASGRW